VRVRVGMGEVGRVRIRGRILNRVYGLAFLSVGIYWFGFSIHVGVLIPRQGQE
jgi:hypothetical protein